MRFPPTPGEEKFVELPIGHTPSCTSFPPEGIALYARNWACWPRLLAAHSIHTTPLPSSVPSEVMTGEPEYAPNASGLSTGAVNPGFPFPSTAYLNAIRLPECPAPPAMLPPPVDVGTHKYPP